MVAKPTIFVQIPSYRDKECVPTVEDVFEKAKHPERIYVGVCWQYNAEAGETPLAFPLKPNIRVLNIPASESKGVAWGKHQAQSLWQGEDYILQIDSHTRLVGNWDEKILTELQNCPSEKPVLSCPPPGYIAPNIVRKDNLPTFRCPKAFNEKGILTLAGDMFDTPLSAPVPAAFAVPRFIFSSSQIIKEVPADPYLYVEEEEVTLSARLWTHGFDIYSPSNILLYHLYNQDGKQRPLHWKDHANWATLQVASRKRYHYIMGLDIPKANDPSPELTTYGLGKRSLAEYSTFCGVDFSGKGALKEAEHCPFIEAIRKHKTVASYWLPAATPIVPISAPILPLAPQKTIRPASPIAIGDFIPYFSLPDETGKLREIHLFAGHNVALYFLPASDVNFLHGFFETMKQHREAFAQLNIMPVYIFLTHKTEVASIKKWLDITHSLWADEDRGISRLFGIAPDETGNFMAGCFLLSPNLQVVNAYAFAQPSPHGKQLLQDAKVLLPIKETHVVTTPHAPVLVVPNVLSKERCEKLIAYWEANEKFYGKVGAGKNSTYNKSAKIRSDVAVKDDLLERLDDVLSGTLFPEIEKVFGLEVTRREEYKIGCYDAKEGGFFNQHRDNFELPLSHRRYAMTLNLNDNFEGGGLNFPEYGEDVYKTPAGTAVIFPCSLMHRATKVTKGKRFMLVSFFYGEEEAMKRYHMLQQEGKPVSPDDRHINSPRKELETKTPGSRAGILIPSTPSPILSAPNFIPSLNKPFDVMKEGVPPGILVIKNFLDSEVCQAIKDYSDATMGRKLEVVDNELSTKEKTVTKVSDHRITEYVKIDGIADRLLPLFIHVHARYLEPFYNVNFEWFERPQILRYTAGGKYGQHADSEHLDKSTNTWVRAQDRDYSTLTYLNDDYGGGEILFNNFDFKIKPTTGMLVAFPSDHRYLHTALPTTSGVRYVIVSWSAILGTPRVKDRAPYAATFLKLR